MIVIIVVLINQGKIEDDYDYCYDAELPNKYVHIFHLLNFVEL